MFTLAPAGHDSSICLRCQYCINLSRLIPMSRRRPFPNTFPIKFHPTSHPRPFTLHARRRQKNAQKLHTDSFSRQPPLLRNEENNRRSGWHRLPPPKIALGVESMGEPAEVLVLHKPPHAARNIGVIFSDEPEEPFPTSLEGSSEAFLDGIDSERGIVDLDQACGNIDRIRDALMETRQEKLAILSAEDYDGIVSKLLAGFKKKHLAGYWRRSGLIANLDALNLHFPYRSPLFARSAWTPDIKSLEQANAPPLVAAGDTQTQGTSGRLSLQDRGKQWHAEHIVQKCWGLYQEHIDTAGELNVRLQGKHLQLLLNHANDPLAKFSKTYSVKLEVLKKQNLIRVGCDFATSEDVMRMLLHILESIQSSVVLTGAVEAEADNLATKALDNTYLKEVEKLTNTIIVGKQANQRGSRSINPREYIVYYLGPVKDDLEDARRLLNVQMHSSLNKQPSCTLIKTPLPSTIAAIPVDFGIGLPLVARSMQWARFAQPNHRQSETRFGTYNSRPLSNSAELLGQMTDFLRGPEIKPIEESLQTISSQHWARKLTRWSCVVLGQLAFPLQQARKMETKLKNFRSNLNYPDISQQGISDLQRAFATTIPRITRVLETSAVSMLPTEKLLIRMVPVPSLNFPSAAMGRVPQLEILIDLHGKTRMTSFAGARLVVAHDELDLLLPSHTTDVRFMRRLYLYSDREQTDPHFTDFVNASNFDIWGSERLRTPNDLHISVPIRTIAESDEKELEETNEVHLVGYKFASLEHRTDLSLPMVGSNRPQYTTIEAGRLGGRREELAMGLGYDRDSIVRKDDEEHARLVSEQNARSLLEAASSMIRAVESDIQGARS